MSTITASEFDYIRDLVRREAAIVLEPGKEYLAENRLHPVARQAGLDSVGALVQQLRSGSGDLQSQVVDALTTNETSFFRDGHPWTALRDEILPDLIERRADRRTLTIWCAAASSGQEPYSLALLLQEHFAEQLDGWVVRIIATDISSTMLERCRTARYSQLEVNRGLPAAMLVRHFRRVGTQWELDPQVRSVVELRKLNLDQAQDWERLPVCDLVLIRNVLIYFDQGTKAEILHRCADHLRPDGYLFLGSSETPLNVVQRFVRVPTETTICYRPA
jgi:chemotaxis protein methyltransferase CheR